MDPSRRGVFRDGSSVVPPIRTSEITIANALKCAQGNACVKNQPFDAAESFTTGLRSVLVRSVLVRSKHPNSISRIAFFHWLLLSHPSAAFRDWLSQESHSRYLWSSSQALLDE